MGNRRTPDKVISERKTHRENRSLVFAGRKPTSHAMKLMNLFLDFEKLTADGSLAKANIILLFFSAPIRSEIEIALFSHTENGFLCRNGTVPSIRTIFRLQFYRTKKENEIGLAARQASGLNSLENSHLQIHPSLLMPRNVRPYVMHGLTVD